MCNGLCGGAAALVTVCRALMGKQRGKHFSKPGRAKKKEFKPQSLQDLFIRSTGFCYEGDTWLWKIQSCFVQRANSVFEFAKTVKNFKVLFQSATGESWLSPSVKIWCNCSCRASMCKVRKCSLRYQGQVWGSVGAQPGHAGSWKSVDSQYQRCLCSFWTSFIRGENESTLKSRAALKK